MAQSIGNYALDTSRTDGSVFPELWKLRLAFGWTILFGAVVSFFAFSWDIQWHSAVGRDRTLTMPHLFILVSLVVMGLAALAAVLSETVWARRNPAVAKSGTTFAGLFFSTPGAYLVGYGALVSSIAFPLDQYWHTLYGVDVTIWAPFHIMVLTGVSVCCLGVAELLASGARLAAQRGARGVARAGCVGVIIALATLMGMLSILLPNALSTGFIPLGNLALTVFPLMLGAFGMFVLTIAVRALPWPAMASSVALVYVLYGLVNFLIIPPLMTWLLGIEQQSLRQNAPTASVLAIEWQYGFVIAAVLLDIAIWFARHRGWSLKKANLLMLGAGLLGMSAAALASPEFLAAVMRKSTPGVAIQGHRVSSGVFVVTRVALPGPSFNPIVIVVVSLLLGLLGIYIGYWLGASIGASMQNKEQI